MTTSLNHMQRSILRSALFSAKIEGNRMTMTSLELSPRQEEIYRILKDHKIASFDTIKRRFLKVNERTLRYDILKLQKKRYITKIGKTKGSFYKDANLTS